jgi:hypothetical protein
MNHSLQVKLRAVPGGGLLFVCLVSWNVVQAVKFYFTWNLAVAYSVWDYLLFVMRLFLHSTRYKLITISTLYMFRAHHAYHQERQIVSIQPLLIVTVCRWPCCAQDMATDTEWQLPEVVLTQFISPDDEPSVLETCRELKIKINT